MPDLKEAKTQLEKATTDCSVAKGIADAYGNFEAAKRRIAADREQINKLPADQKTLVVKELESIDSQIELATAKAEIEKKPQDAIPLLEKARRELDQARIKLDMHSTLNSPAPNPAFLKLLAKEPGGTDMLDGMVAQMGESTPRNVLEAALEARFVGIDLEQHLTKNMVNLGTDDDPKMYHGASDKQAPDKSVKRIYDLLLKVPDSHVQNNPQIKLIRRFQEDVGGGSHNSGSGRIDLYAGRAGATTSHDQGAQLASPEYFPEGVHPDCQPRADAKTKDVRYFDWATMHEVGHGVDEKDGFMTKNGGKDEFGGWKVYDKDVTEPAKAAQRKFNYDLNYIKKRLAYNNDRIQRAKKKAPAPGDPAPLPEPGAAAKPANRDAKEWEATQKKVDEWCATVMGLRLWWDGAASKKVAVDGIVYQLSYDWPEWVSYKYDARKQGVHGYQFRAPGEWFAEIYAAYYMDLLKPVHPVIKAIKKASPDALADRET